MTIARICVLVAGLWAFAGCQGGGAMHNQAPPNVADHSDEDQTAAAYYYFSSAQIKLKEGQIREAQWLLERALQHDPRSASLKLELAHLYLAQKEFPKALKTVENLLRDAPNDTQALILAGRIYQDQEKLPEAKVFYERALANNPTDPNIYLYLGRIYWNEKDLGSAGRVFAQMVERLPDSYAAYYFNGKVLLALDRKQEAEAAFRRSLELEPALEEPRLELIKLYRERGDTDGVMEMYQFLLGINPDNVEASVELALLYRHSGQQEKGEQLLSELARHSDEDTALVSYLFDNYLDAKQYAAAAWVIQCMLKGAPESGDLHYLAGVTYDGLKLTREAVEQLQQVPQQSRFYKNAVVYRSLLMRDAGQAEQSIAVVQKALQQDPSHIDYYLYLGMFYEELAQYGRALDILTKGLNIDHDNIRLYFRLGVVHDKAGHKQDAIEAMKKILRLQPQDTEALNYLGYTYADLGIHLEEAEGLIQNALSLKPDDGYITDSLAWIYYKQGRYEDALVWLSKADRLVPNDPTILEHLGDVNLKLNLQDKALKYYRRSLEVNGKDRGELEKKIRALGHDALQPTR